MSPEPLSGFEEAEEDHRQAGIDHYIAEIRNESYEKQR